MNGKKPTSHDVARLAGVSQTTVSYVMSGRRAVAPETENRVLHAMEELGYHPHSGARALRSSRSNVIGLVVPQHAGADPVAQHQFLISLAHQARAHDYDILLVTADEGTSGLRRVMDSALCDGLLLMEVLAHDPRADMIADSHTPAVFIGIPDSCAPITAIDSDYEYAGRHAVDILAQSGHTRITLLAPGDTSLQDLNFIERFRNAVYEHAAASAIEIREHKVTLSYQNAISQLEYLNLGYGDALLLAPTTPTDDWCNALRNKNLIPGQHVSLVASSWDYTHSHTLDRPCHFDMRMGEVTKQAMNLLLERIDAPTPSTPDHHLITPFFHEGDTLRTLT
ncbi:MULTISPECIES: LacI family DNA-binding transcriptional regulator [unclassified Schaalia]|uniref:LacI family DNA-binding transcriptional regulator n=1 Tax=unclassified Schaalia TaxID=2691889 RepID=UPI001E4E1EB1|nr:MULTISPECIES: LacI family DNA-binding transcriptional regulator [unclassified Schaalia]MCD4550062.1 LacI family transcriptional regulator [Schaalia sp. lx-260]MCD4557871.1 LacI family transcriptional regulator [Schaalia sp. lx-100]